MKLLLAILLLAYSNCLSGQLTNAFDQNGNKNGLWISNYDSGRICGSYTHGKKNGLWTKYAGNSMVSALNYVNGQLSGASISFYRNSSMHIFENYVNGRLEGDVYFYSHDGCLLAIYNYARGILNERKYLIVDPESPPSSHIYTPKFDENTMDLKYTQ